MKKIFILLCLAGVMALTGCDAFRSLAGKPTSSEIQLKKSIIDSLNAAHQARIDSLKRIEKALSDSLAVLDSLKQSGGTILNPSSMGGLFTTRLDYRYYVVIGAFTQRSYAERLLTKAKEAGYIATLISFRNGYNAVGLSQTDHLEKAFAALKQIKEEPFCPKDVWILVNE
ncbi:MAG: SPOR domain-containing protein [Bacteroidales bacterium]|nr:SPOR domain-containing protein [Bacteroidales bacterium]